MNEIQVNTPSKCYSVYIENSFDSLSEVFIKSGLQGKKLLCVTDENVSNIYLETLRAILAPLSDGFHVFIFKPGEASKSLEITEEIYNTLITHGFNRSSVIVALGGGVTGDLAGFAASTFMRGIKFLQIPTTLLAQVDSSVGGKVAVNLKGAKNMVGSFYQPEFVYINTKTLETLNKNEFISGMGEVIKYAFIKDAEFLEYLHKNRKSIEEYNSPALSYIIEKSLGIKAEIVSKDEKETGIREILNFGHTFGHAIESLSGYRLTHGMSIGLGMACALYLSMKYGAISIGEYRNALKVINSYGLSLAVEDYDLESLYKICLKDKKTKNQAITLILLNAIGYAYSKQGVSKEDIIEAFSQIRSF